MRSCALAPFEQLAYLPSPCFWQAFYKHLAPNAEATLLLQGSSVKACFSPGSVDSFVLGACIRAAFPEGTQTAQQDPSAAEAVLWAQA